MQQGWEVIKQHGDLEIVALSQGEGGGLITGGRGCLDLLLLSSEKHSVLHLVPINITSKGEHCFK